MTCLPSLSLLPSRFADLFTMAGQPQAMNTPPQVVQDRSFLAQLANRTDKNTYASAANSEWIAHLRNDNHRIGTVVNKLVVSAPQFCQSRITLTRLTI